MDNSDSKQPYSSVQLRAVNNGHDIGDIDQQAAAATWATANDVHDMDALGLEPTFKRRFRPPSVFFFYALYNGGTGGLFWGFVFSIFGLGLVYLTIAELSSSFPTAGGQYQWVADCAPHSMRHVLAYTTGWLLTLSWMTYLAVCPTIIGNTVKFCILVYYPDNAAANSQWLPTLIALILLSGAGAFNIYLAKHLPTFEYFMLFIHLGGFVAVVATLWATSPIGNAYDVIFKFTNPAGWTNAGAASLIGIITPWGALLGYDSSVHMTENAKDASRTIPLSLLTAYGLNAALAFVAGVTMIFCVGDIESVLASFSPFVQIFLNSTGSKAGTILLILPMLLAYVSACVSEVATASRQLWSFARDGGLPFGYLLVPVHDAETPRRAVWATIALSSAITCINFGPVVGFNAIVSLAICALTFSYSLTTACTIWRRYFGKGLPLERFNLGRAGGIINILALCCCLPVTVISVFPSVPNPSPAYMNWAILVFGVVTIVALLNYIFSGRHNFNPPIRKVL